jgi:hypothetical protein
VIDGLVKVLFVRVSVEEIVGTVTPEICNVFVLTVPPVHVPFVDDGVVIIGEVNVLFVNVSVVARPTKVSVVDGNVNGLPAFVNTGEFNVGAVNVLFVSV